VWIGFIWLKIGTSGESSEHGNEPSGSIKGGGEFLEKPTGTQLVKELPALY
jgi:hypothetical protein